MVVQYNPATYWSTLLIWKGSVMGSVVPQLAISCTVTVLCIVYYRYIRAHDQVSDSDDWDSFVHGLLNHSVSLLLVFRSDLAYKRYLRGRHVLDSVINNSLRIISLVCSYSVGETYKIRRLREEVRRSILVMFFLFKCILTGTVQSSIQQCPRYKRRSWDGEYIDVPLLTEKQKIFFRDPSKQDSTLILQEALELSSALNALEEDRVISQAQLSQIDVILQDLTESYREIWSMHEAQIPFPYVQLTHCLTFLFLTTLPFVLVRRYGWFTLVTVLMAALAYYGINQVAMEIQDPFGTDINDFDIKEAYANLEEDTFSLIDLRVPQLNTPDPVIQKSVWNSFYKRISIRQPHVAEPLYLEQRRRSTIDMSSPRRRKQSVSFRDSNHQTSSNIEEGA